MIGKPLKIFPHSYFNGKYKSTIEKVVILKIFYNVAFGAETGTPQFGT